MVPRGGPAALLLSSCLYLQKQLVPCITGISKAPVKLRSGTKFPVPNNLDPFAGKYSHLGDSREFIVRFQDDNDLGQAKCFRDRNQPLPADPMYRA